LEEETQAVFASDVLKQVKLRRLAALACGTILAGSMLSLTLPAYAQAVKKKTVTTEAQAEQPAADAGTIRLDQIVVTATGFEQNVKDAPASITVVPREELEKGSFRSLTDALANVQGVAVTGGANSQDIMIRGLPGAYTLILVDGKRQSTRDARTNSNISGYEQSYMPPASAIERIEVVRGPMSSLYGSDAMGGVINIITRKVDDAWHGEVTVDGTVQNKSRYGNSGQASFYVSGPLVPEVAGLQVWGRGMKRNEDKILNGTQEQRDGDISGKLTLTPNEDHDIFLEGGITRVRREANPDYTLAENGAYNYNHNDRKHWSVTHVGRWGPTTSEFTFQQEWAKRTTWAWKDDKQAIIEDTRIPEIRNSVLDGKFTTPFEFYGDHTLVTGGQYFDAHLKDQNPGYKNILGKELNETFNIRQWALFMEDEWWVTQDFALTGGLRMDDHEVYGSHFSPRAYAVWHANEQLTFKGGISTGFKAPEIRTIAPGYAYTTGGRNCNYDKKTCGVIIGDDSLKAEKSTSYELAALWDNQNGLQLGGTYFYTDFKDKISNRQILDDNGDYVYWDQDPNYRLWKNFNIDNAVMQGVELTVNWEATDDIRLRASYTYTHSRQKGGDFDGLPLTRTPEHMGNIRADWITPVEGLSAWTAANYHGSEVNAGARLGVNPIGKPIYDKKGKAIAAKYDAYMTFDIGTSYEFSENVSFNAALYNLFDKRIEESDFNTSVDGRRLWVSMTSKF
jgi:outer membrane receptor for ferrienterochelin and colicins